MDLILLVYSLMEGLTVKQGLRWLEHRIHNVIPGLNHYHIAVYLRVEITTQIT